MNVEEIMTRQVETCCSSDSLNRAAQLMWEHDCGCVPVVEGGKPVAMLTDRDICMAAYTQGKPLADMSVSSAASHGAVCVQEGNDIEVAEALMQEHRIRRVPVVDRDGKLAGIVSMNDIARHVQFGHQRHDGLGAESIVRTVAAICQPARRHVEPPSQHAHAAE